MSVKAGFAAQRPSGGGGSSHTWYIPGIISYMRAHVSTPAVFSVHSGSQGEASCLRGVQQAGADAGFIRAPGCLSWHRGGCVQRHMAVSLCVRRAETFRSYFSFLDSGRHSAPEVPGGQRAEGAVRPVTDVCGTCRGLKIREWRLTFASEKRISEAYTHICSFFCFNL